MLVSFWGISVLAFSIYHEVVNSWSWIVLHQYRHIQIYVQIVIDRLALKSVSRTCFHKTVCRIFVSPHIERISDSFPAIM